MTIADALTDIRGFFSDYVSRGAPTGPITKVEVYRAGFSDVRRGKDYRVQRVGVVVTKKMTRSYVSDDDTQIIHEHAEAFADWLHDNSPGGMFVWWGEPINLSIEETGEGLEGTIVVALAIKPPQV